MACLTPYFISLLMVDSDAVLNYFLCIRLYSFVVTTFLVYFFLPN